MINNTEVEMTGCDDNITPQPSMENPNLSDNSHDRQTDSNSAQTSSHKTGRASLLEQLAREILSSSNYTNDITTTPATVPTVNVSVIAINVPESSRNSNNFEKVSELSGARHVNEAANILKAKCQTLHAHEQDSVLNNVSRKLNEMARVSANRKSSLIMKIKEQLGISSGDRNIGGNTFYDNKTIDNDNTETSDENTDSEGDNFHVDCENCSEFSVDKDEDLDPEQYMNKDEQRSIDDLEFEVIDEENNIQGLAVAVRVERDNRDIPSAIQYDPEMKPSFFASRRRFLFIFLILFTVIAGSVGAGIGIVLHNKTDIKVPLLPYRTTIGIRENIRFITSEAQLSDETSPYRKALDWITFVDPLQLTPNNTKLVQRYIIAYIYFATSSKGPWTSGCAPATNETGLIRDQCQFNKTLPWVEGEEYRVKEVSAYRWLSGTDECDWAGINCDKLSQVQSLELRGMGLSGTFPEGIVRLPFLEEIAMTFGSLEGPLPDYLSSMKHLVHIDLQSNLFTGTIPESWYTSRNLQQIDIQVNNISGTISKSISQLQNTKRFYMDDNLLEGTIPSELGLMGNLNDVSLAQNNFNGTIPTTIGNMKNLWNLWLFGNRLTGTIPSTIGGCSNLMDLRIHDNFLEGPIPREVLNFAETIIRMQINDNQLNGTIGFISKLTNLYYLKLNNNNFMGTIPSRLGSSNSLKEVFLGGNDFVGTMPTQICDKVYTGKIDILESDCAGSTNIEPAITCPCCTSCCEQNSKICHPVSANAETDSETGTNGLIKVPV